MAAVVGALMGHLDTLIRKGKKEVQTGNFQDGITFFRNAHQVISELETKLEKDETLEKFRGVLMQRKVDVLNYIAQAMTMQEAGQVQPQRVPAASTTGLDTKKLEMPLDNKILLKDICGLNDVKAALIDVMVTPFFYPGVIPPEHQFNGIMLYGPSGAGKTKIVKAMVNSLNATLDFKIVFLNISMDVVLGKHHGDTERNLSEVFDVAKTYTQPVLLFFDEFDGIAGTRGSSGRHEAGETKIVNHFLHLLDGVKENSRIVVVVTTNRPYSVDCSFYRRFRMLSVPLPNKDGRAALLRHLVGRIQKLDIPESTKIDFENLAVLTYGYSPADLTGLVSTAIQSVRLAPVTAAIRQNLELNKKFKVPAPDTFDCIKKVLTYENLLTAKRQTTPTNVDSYLTKLESFTNRHAGNSYFPLPPVEPDLHCNFCKQCFSSPCSATAECIMMFCRLFFDGC